MKKKIPIKIPDAKLVTIHTLTDAVEAELVRNTLLDHDIECQLDGELQGGFTGTFEIGVVVRETDVNSANEILQIHHANLFGEN